MDFRLLENSKIEQGTLVTYGMVSDVIGKTGTISFTETNLLKTDRAVAAILTAENGQAFRIVCSKPLGVAIRSKELSPKDITSFPIIEYTTQVTQEKIPMITFPEGSGQVITFKASEMNETPFVRKSAYKPEDLIAL